MASQPLSPSVLVIIIFIVFQLTHWFKPSEPYLVDYARENGGIPNSVVYDSVYPWYTWTLLPCTLLAGIVWEFAGPVVALGLAAVADILSVALVIPATSVNLAPFIASEFAFSLSFTSLFLVSATLAHSLAPADFQRAASYNRAATLVSTMSSALLGQLLVDNGQLSATVYVSLGASIVSAGGLLACVALHLLPSTLAAPPAATRPAPSMWTRVCQQSGDVLTCLRHMLRDGHAVTLSVTLAIFLATHTLALTYWQSLLEVIAPSEVDNGGVLAGAYAASAIATWLPSFPAIDRACMRNVGPVSLIATLITGALLIMFGRATSLLMGALWFVAYHALAEASIVVLNAQLGRRVAALMETAATSPQQQQQRVSASVNGEGDSTTFAHVQVATERHGIAVVHAHVHIAEIDDDGSTSDRPLLADAVVDTEAKPPRARFGAIFSTVTFVSQAFQIALQTAIGPQGVGLALPSRYVVFGCVVLALAVVLALSFTLQLLRAACTQPLGEGEQDAAAVNDEHRLHLVQAGPSAVSPRVT